MPLTEEWLRVARNDLALAAAPLPAGVFPATLCYHAQQATEKALKGLLVAVGCDPPRTHHIATLLDALEPSIPVPERIREAALLTDYSVTARYPFPSEPVGAEELREAVTLAAEVLSFVEERLRNRIS